VEDCPLQQHFVALRGRQKAVSALVFDLIESPAAIYRRVPVARFDGFDVADFARLALPGLIGSKTIRTRACSASATRRGVLSE